MSAIDPLSAAAVMLVIAATNAVFIVFTSAVIARRRVPAIACRPEFSAREHDRSTAPGLTRATFV
jgi:hypothetical protein